MKDHVLCELCFLIKINCLSKTCCISAYISKEREKSAILNKKAKLM